MNRLRIGARDYRTGTNPVVEKRHSVRGSGPCALNMSEENMAKERSVARRAFLAKAGVGAAVGAAFGRASNAFAQTASPAGAAFQPVRHPEDDWLDQLPGKHRLFFDSTTAGGFGEAISYANNFFQGNKNGYGLDAKELAVIVSARHWATAFLYTDEMWAKYGKPLADRAEFTDPKTKTAPNINVYRASGYGSALSSLGITLDALVGQGVHFAACQLSTRANASAIARQTGGNANEIYNELAAHLVPNARLVPAGIVAVNRAQERGYSLSYAG